MDYPLVTSDGLRLHVQHWPAGDPARGTVLIVHGLGEHIGRYARAGRAIECAGDGMRWGMISAATGARDGARGAIARRDALLHDLALVVDAVRAGLPSPLVMLGHSLGGLVAARFVAGGTEANARHAPWFREVDALVLSSPAFDPGMSATQKALLAVLGRLAPNVAVNNGLKPEWISRDRAVVEAYKSDALVHERVTPRLVRFIVDGAVRSPSAPVHGACRRF